MMSKMFYRVMIFCLAAVLLGSCVYDFTPSGNELPGMDKPLVVIEGDIIVGGITNVELKSTRPVLNGVEQEEISFQGTSVWVESENGGVWQGAPAADEGYGSKFVVDTRNLPLDGKYRLCVSVPDRGEYVSEFKRVMVSPQIDSVTYTRAEDRSSLQFEVSTHNDSKEKLYCRWSFTEDWESNSELNADIRAVYVEGDIVMEEMDDAQKKVMSKCYSHATSKEIYIGSTEKLSQNVINKERLHVIYNTDRRISSLYSINISQTAMDKDAYKYWETTKASVSGTGGLFAPMPSEIRGNISSVTYPQEKVLGYVNVSTETSVRLFYYSSEFNMYKRNCADAVYPKTEKDLEGNEVKVWLQLYLSGMKPVRYEYKENGDPIKTQAYWTSEPCVDCRVFSNSSRPDFWPKGR
jgi:hypothetical protein